MPPQGILRNKLMYRFVATTKKKKRKQKQNRPVFRDGMPPQGILRKKKKKKEIDPFLDTVCPLRASRVKRNRPVFRHGTPSQGIPRNKKERDRDLNSVPSPAQLSNLITA